VEINSVAGPRQFSRVGAFSTKGRDLAEAYRGPGRKATVAQWIVQALLALTFLAAGGMKLALPMDVLAQLMPLPALFMKFVGVCETLGAIGLILPGLLRIRLGLTPLAAAGLVIVMVGATTCAVAVGQGPAALLPFALGLLAASVAYARRSAITS
jgi:hypothetical protein